MYVTFSELPRSSKIWIYQSDRKLNADETRIIEKELKSFCDEWTAHSLTLKASFDIRYNYFIILAVDESMNDASGCSIDKSVSEIKKLEKNLNLSFFNRENIAFYVNGDVIIKPLSEIKNLLNDGKINGQSIFFNNLAASINELSHDWMMKCEDSWLRTYIQK